MKHQSGNALWFILVAIGLLGLLTVMMSRSSSSTNETGGYEQNVIQANQILSYAKNMENAVQSLLARGCSENDISFWHDSDGNGSETAADDYFNANSPNDRSCHVFDGAGMGLSWENPDVRWISSSQNWSVTGMYEIREVGGSHIPGCNSANQEKRELIMILPAVNRDLCMSINDTLGLNYSDIPEEDSMPSYPHAFVGSYDGNGGCTAFECSYGISATCDKQHSMCFEVISGANPNTYFYHVLHARQ